MRKNYYQVFEEIQDDIFMHINCMNGAILLLDKHAHDLYENFTEFSLVRDKTDSVILKSLWKLQFLVEDNYNEKEIVQLRKMIEINDSTMYHIIINSTLDCNLSCWYCYEHKYKGSKLEEPVIQGIKRHLSWKIKNEPFSLLKLSFFGGEPFYNYYPIRSIIEYAKSLCLENGKNLYLDFTTNGTLLTKDIVSFLSDFSCQFEITIDGNKQQHNRIKYTKDRKVDTYSLTFKNIMLIHNLIPSSLIFLRINFDSNTLKDFDDIYQEIIRMDPHRTIVILKKVWQVDDKVINSEDVIEVASKLQSAGFRVDYYTQGKLCFAERLNEVVINYDGKIFKCTTISDFNADNSYGMLDCLTGQIKWNESKLAKDNNTKSPQQCLSCKMYPMCYGPCPNQINAGNSNCFFDTLNMSKKEYFRYMFTEYLLNKK